MSALSDYLKALQAQQAFLSSPYAQYLASQRQQAGPPPAPPPQQAQAPSGASVAPAQVYVDANGNTQITDINPGPGWTLVPNDPGGLLITAANASKNVLSGNGPNGKPPDPNAASTTQNEKDALAVLQGIFNQYGFSAADSATLSTWAWGLLTQGYQQDAIMAQLPQQQVFQNAFPAMALMRQQGLTPPTPAEYLATVNNYKQVMTKYGITPSQDVAAYNNLFTNQISASELDQRSQMYDKIVNIYGPHMRQMFQQYAGMNPNSISNDDLYKLMSGQDPSLAQKYAQITGTPMGKLSFQAITDAEDKALAAQQAEFMPSGAVASGPTAGTEEQTIRARTSENFTTAPVSAGQTVVGGSI